METLTDEQMAELAASPAILVPFATPWAVDAEGRALETEFIVEDGRLVQMESNDSGPMRHGTNR